MSILSRRSICIPLFAVALAVAGCGKASSPDDEDAPGKSSGAAEAKPAGIDPKDLPLPQVSTGLVNIYTPSPGFRVFVDGELARNESGEPLETPCQVSTSLGQHVLIVAQDGFRDKRHDLDVRKENDVISEPVEADAEDAMASILKSEYIDAPTAEPVPLLTLNSAGNETDPFVSADGLSIWFISDRPEGRGVWTARRSTPLHAFGQPEYLSVTRSTDPYASPTLTADGQLLVFATPSKARISSLLRPSAEAEFGKPKAIQFSHADAFWPVAQILGNGTHLYWAESDAPDKPLRTMSAVRKRRDLAFSQTAPVTLPGVIPCLSSDGLRQYVFDGKVLQRARRTGLSEPFSRLEVVANVTLENYVPSKSRRQFWVSEDEQWLYYSDNPDESGDLSMVRLVAGRGWGLALTGKSIPPLQVASRRSEESTSEPETTADPTPTADARDKPLSYTEHWEQFQKLMGQRKYDEAAKAVAARLASPEAAADRALLAWDREDVATVQAFWSDVRSIFEGLKPGKLIRIGSARVELLSFKGDVIRVKARTKEIDKPIGEISPVDLSALMDDELGKDREDVQMKIGAFLYYDPEGNDRSAAARLERAGDAGQKFLERIPARMLHRAQQEAARENSGAALALIQEILDQHADSRAAGEAKTLQEEIYKLVKWNTIGSRRWESGAEGEYTAAPGRSKGAGLQSSKSFENFELRLEWKVQGELGQGGVYFRWNGEEDPGTANAFKLHLANDAGQGRDAFSTGSLFKVESPALNAALEEGKWNTLVLRVHGEKVNAVINGKKVLDTTATSKDIGKSGYVVLDGEVGGITYRRAVLVELPPLKEKTK